MDENFLIHYGVLGMKWGIRKARKKGIDYVYKSPARKSLEKKISKGIDVPKNKEKLDIIKIRDRKRVNYAKQTKIGSEIARKILFSPFGAGAYANLRASGMSRRNAYTAAGRVRSRKQEYDVAKIEYEINKTRR